MRGALEDIDWVYTDDERHFPPSQVLGERQLKMFGTRRGYWSRGPQEYPALCRLFGIEARLTPDFVARFLAEIRAEVERRSDREVLEAEPALPKMLLACHTWLGARPDHRPARPR